MIKIWLVWFLQSSNFSKVSILGKEEKKKNLSYDLIKQSLGSKKKKAITMTFNIFFMTTARNVSTSASIVFIFSRDICVVRSSYGPYWFPLHWFTWRSYLSSTCDSHKRQNPLIVKCVKVWFPIHKVEQHQLGTRQILTQDFLLNAQVDMSYLPLIDLFAFGACCIY